jgi:hypothetical protein
LMSMEPQEAEYHMNRCIASGLWNTSGWTEEGKNTSYQTKTATKKL